MDTLDMKLAIDSSYVLVPIPIIGIIILALYFLRNRKNVTSETQNKDQQQNSSKKNDSTNAHHHHHHHHQHHHQQHHHHHQQQQTTKSSKSSKGRQNKRGITNNSNTIGNTGNDHKTSSHPWLASNLKGHTDDIHDIDFSNNGKFLASCSEASNNKSNTSNGHHHHHHQHHHQRGVIRNDRRKESTSTDSTGSGTDDNNGSSGNEDNSVPYNNVMTKKQKSKSGRNRRQGKNQTKSNDNEDETPNTKVRNNGQTSSSASSSPTGSPQQKSSLRKSPKNSNNKNNGKQNNNNQNHQNHQHHSNNQHHQHHQQHHQQQQQHQQQKNFEINHFIKISRAVLPPLRQHTKLNIKESELTKFLRYYVIDPNLLRIYGYPVESALYEGSFEIFKCLPRPFTHFKTNGTVNGSRSITPRSDIINKNDGLITPSEYKKWNSNLQSDSLNMHMHSTDSGHGSESSSPAAVDSDESSETGEEETTTIFYTPDGSYQIFSNYCQSIEKQCVRCKREFLVDENGEYLTHEECYYHWGKLQQIYTSNRTFGYQYTCCNGDQLSVGCSKNRLHVWTGVTVGINGPYDDYVRTSSSSRIRIYDSDDDDDDITIEDGDAAVGDDGRVYSLDCEMCFTGLGLELTKVTVVNSSGHLVYETFVKPKCEIVDYNTRFSGITEKDFQSKNNSVKSIEEVQTDLLELIDETTILIGHGLDNDLRALKLYHTNIIDTSISFPHVNGFPYRRALKTLTKNFLNRDIQTAEENGHCSLEDSRACLELMLWRVRKDFRVVLEK